MLSKLVGFGSLITLATTQLQCTCITLPMDREVNLVHCSKDMPSCDATHMAGGLKTEIQHDKLP